MTQLSEDTIKYVFNHVVLPPRLPHSREADEIIRDGETALIDMLVDQVKSFTRLPESEGAWQTIQKMLQNVRRLFSVPRLSSGTMIAALERLDNDDVLPIQLQAQNACLTVRMISGKVIFEAYEVSALASDVLASEGALVRVFPAHALAISKARFKDPAFLDALCFRLDQLANDVVDEMLPPVSKAGVKSGDLRDTADPVLVTDALMAILTSIAEPVTPISIRKRDRDDAVCRSGRSPWRRSALWLILRVTIQTTLTNRIGHEEAISHYKCFMIYFLSELAQLGHQASLPDELCHIITTKIARRVMKLGLPMDFVTNKAMRICKTIRGEQQSRWDAECSRNPTRSIRLDPAVFEQHTKLALNNSKEYLKAVLTRRFEEDKAGSAFSPNHRPLLTWKDGLPTFANTDPNNGDRIYALAELEEWIGLHLPAWVNQSSSGQRDPRCKMLARLAERYYLVASTLYSGHPHLSSTLIFTIIQMWYGVDRLATAKIPLLKSYPPELPLKVFAPLLLPQKWQMETLHKIEGYILDRHRQSNAKSVFESFGENDTFAQRYFDKHKVLKDLKKSIEEDAEEQREEKRAEWQEKSIIYANLNEEAQDQPCYCMKDIDGNESPAATDCPKCSILEKARDMSIEIHEWPLPEQKSAAASIFFELACPKSFVAWRNITRLLIHDIGGGGDLAVQNSRITLANHPGLQGFYEDRHSRIGLTSTNRTAKEAHQNELSFPVDVERCFSDCSIWYELLDLRKSLRVSAHDVSKMSFLDTCTPDISKSIYSSLQYAIQGTDHSQNLVISQQCQCPETLSLQAFLRFGSLRADGEHAQWLKIANELAAPHLDINAPEVVALFLQAAWQACSASSTSYLRHAHMELVQHDFVFELLELVERRFRSMCDNWKSAHAIRLFVGITLRILSLAEHESIITKALALLQQVRIATFGWTNRLATIMSRSPDSRNASLINEYLRWSALLCKLTYAVDAGKRSALMDISGSIQYWVYCSIRLHESLPAGIKNLSADLQALILEDQKLSQKLALLVRDRIVSQADPGLDQALSLLWSDSHPESLSWIALKAHNDRWVYASRASSCSVTAKTIQYNVVEATLLINGETMHKLPADYTSSAIYVRMFGDKQPLVVPSTLQGFKYMTCQPTDRGVLHFGFQDQELIIRAVSANAVFELLPPDILDGDVPGFLQENYSHWLDISTETVDFEPRGGKGKEVSEWQLTAIDAGQAQLVKDSKLLIDVCSATSEEIMETFGTLDSLAYVQATLCENILEVALVRFDLHFTWQDDSFFCTEFGKIVDSNQDIGTLIGLQNKLVLCAPEPLAQEHDRMVLVPYGEVTWSLTKWHVDVAVEIEVPAKLFQYGVDRTLQRLRDNGEAQHVLFKAYLHAVTSHFLPDPLTARTGTEEALAYLGRRSLRFFKPPGEAETRLIQKMARLTPGRAYSPRQSRVMQAVNWDDKIPSLSQHTSFLPSANELLLSGNDFATLYENQPEALSLYTNEDPHLHERAKITISRHLCKSLNEQLEPRAVERIHTPRDRHQIQDRSARSAEIAGYVMADAPTMSFTGDISKFIAKLGLVINFGAESAPKSCLSELLQFNLRTEWAPLLCFIRSSDLNNDRYKLLFLFGFIAYGAEQQDLMPLKYVLAYAFSPELISIDIPSEVSRFHFKLKTELQVEPLEKILRSAFRGPSKRGPMNDSRRAACDARDREVEEQLPVVLEFYRAQWACARPARMSETAANRLNHDAAHEEITRIFSTWIGNRLYGEYFERVQSILRDLSKLAPKRKFTFCAWRQINKPAEGSVPAALPCLATLLSSRNAPSMVDLITWVEKGPMALYEPTESILGLIDDIAIGDDPQGIRAAYKYRLLESKIALNSHLTPSKTSTLFRAQQVADHLSTCDRIANKFHSAIQQQLEPQDRREELLKICGLWPRCSLQPLLKSLASTNDEALEEDWQGCLIHLGRAILLKQRACRILLARQRNDLQELQSTLANDGIDLATLHMYPDWLLMQLEGDFLVRNLQAKVAGEMIEPQTGKNSLIQLNMGEGKSSVIMPLVAAAIAERPDQIARVVVLKSLAQQTLDTLMHRQGGLVDRRIFYMPLSRKSEITLDVAKKIEELFRKCSDESGIVVSLPEHLLSFLLQGVERLVTDNLEVAMTLLYTQGWLDANCRDILDECDELLDVKYQLIYSLGTQRMMDGQPDRWLDLQSIFGLIQQHAQAIIKLHPGEYDYAVRTNSCYPVLRPLTARASQTLQQSICDLIFKNELLSFNLIQVPSHIHQAAYEFITQRNVGTDQCQTLFNFYSSEVSMQQKLLHFRGLFACGIFSYVLQEKRWAVNYGLHPQRSMLAVPYRAKGVPTPNAEFGHPDVATTLTCLSYYYAGLDNSQVRKAIEHLGEEDDPSLQYAQWIKDHQPSYEPPSNFLAINLEDEYQCDTMLFPAIRHNKALIDFYLGRVVFPKEGREFDEKISASAWDLAADSSRYLKTGFSGTNENQDCTPTSMHYVVIDETKHTSAMALDILLRPENRSYIPLSSKTVEISSAANILETITCDDPSVKVLIDVGAQILDVTNFEVIQTWIQLREDIQAGIYFDDDGSAIAMSRDGKREKLAHSYFQTRMSDCVVYLDEQRTRGTDLKLPIDARAAVTLGPRLTKDRLLQACGRLRKLGEGQSLCFLASPEVHLQLQADYEMEQLTSFHVISWSMRQSCLAIERAQSLRILQGLNYAHRRSALTHANEAIGERHGVSKPHGLPASLMNLREKETQRLADLYAPEHMKSSDRLGLVEESRDSNDPVVQDLISKFDRLPKNESAPSAPLDEEQEREISHEIEQETLVQRPPRVEPVERFIDPHLEDFITKGSLEFFHKFPLGHDVVVQVTSVQFSEGNRKPWPHIRVTTDFASTVKQSSSGYFDNYLRPVTFGLTSKEEAKPFSLLAISPWEANKYLRLIQGPKSKVNLHIYEPRVAKGMLSVDYGLDPPPRSMKQWQKLHKSLRRELHLFAGQTFFNTCKEYKKTKEELGEDLNPVVSQTMSFLRSWTAIRRMGQDFRQTHVGYLVNQQEVKEEDFD